MTTETWFQGHLEELSREECLELLAIRSVGRIAFDGPDGPEVPVVRVVLIGPANDDKHETAAVPDDYESWAPMF